MLQSLLWRRTDYWDVFLLSSESLYIWYCWNGNWFSKSLHLPWRWWKKGGDNVTSFLFKYLNEKGMFQVGNPGGKLSIILNNSSSQNKNQMVIHFKNWLCKKKYFKHIQESFLMKGHTKNPCDRKFSGLKKTYSKSNMPVIDALIQSFNKGNNLHAD